MCSGGPLAWSSGRIVTFEINILTLLYQQKPRGGGSGTNTPLSEKIRTNQELKRFRESDGEGIGQAQNAGRPGRLGRHGPTQAPTESVRSAAFFAETTPHCAEVSEVVADAHLFTTAVSRLKWARPVAKAMDSSHGRRIGRDF